MTAWLVDKELQPRWPTLPYRRIGGLTMLRAGITSWTRRNSRALPPIAGVERGLPALGVESHDVQVQAHDVATYGRACGYAYCGEAPPTYLHVLSLPLQMALLLDRRFPWPLPGLVHLASRLRQWRPIRPGDVLNLAVWIDRLIAHSKGHAVVVACRVRRTAEIVWEGENVYLRRGAASHVGESWTPLTLPSDAQMRTLETWNVASHIGRRYAWVSGDANPIHLHAWLARLFGFRAAIAHGMWIFARALAGQMPIARRVEAYAEFRSPVFFPSQVCLRAEEAQPSIERTRHWAVQSNDGSQLHAAGMLRELGEV